MFGKKNNNLKLSKVKVINISVNKEKRKKII